MSENELNEIEWIAFFRLWELSVSLLGWLVQFVVLLMLECVASENKG